MKNNLEFHIISMSTYGIGLSGGDRIFIELSKVLARKNSVRIYVWEEGWGICRREGVKSSTLVLWSAEFWSKSGFFINYFARIFISILESFKLKLENSDRVVIYSASEFWQDTFSAIILKLRYPKIIWIAAWYQSAPNPFIGFSEKGKKNFFPNLRALAYWFVQLPVRPFIKKYADIVFVTSEPDRANFQKQDKKGKE